METAAALDGLAAPGKVVLGPDLSDESQNPATAGLDTFGHGTHVAGLTAGRDGEAAAPYTDRARFDSAHNLDGQPDTRQGPGELDLAAAFGMRPQAAQPPADAARGTGTLEGSRGSSGSSWSGSTWSGSTWSRSTWSGSTWSADAWLTGHWA